MWFDRLTQTELVTLPASIDAGRYQWQSSSQNSECFNQHSKIYPNQLLICDGRDYWQLESNKGSFNKACIDNPEQITLFKNAVLTLGQTLTDLNSQAHKNRKSEQLLSPLLPATVINDELKLLDMELALQAVLKAGHLHKIAYQPRLDIRYIEETADVARAKRLAKNALVHLASHSECWQRQTLNGIVPKRIRARFSEDDYQIYENRVFARLVDKLNLHLHSRIRTVEQLQQTINDALGFEGNSDAIDYRVSQKIYALWGQTFDADATLQALELSENTLSSLKAMLKSISGFRQSALYLMIPRHAQVGAELYRTNILNHDTHYRHLAILWDQLNRLQQSSLLTPEEYFAQEQKLAEHYSRYAGLALQHALIGNKQVSTNLNKDSNAIEFIYEWAGRTLCLKQQEYDWQLSLITHSNSHSKTEKQTLLEFIPWFGFSSIPEDLKSLSNDKIILWPSISSISNEQAEAQQAGWYALSPLDLYCVERLGWLIDSKLNELLSKQYAEPILKIPNKVSELISNFKDANSSSFELTGNPPQLRLLKPLQKQEIKQISDAFIQANSLQQEEQLQQQQGAFKALEICMVCGGQTQVIHQPPSGFRTECQNSACGNHRYLKHTGAILEMDFRDKEEGRVIGESFASRGRWAI